MAAAGNLIVAKASSLLQRADEFNKTLTNPADFAKATELQFVTMNAPKLIEGYLTSMDSYVQVGTHRHEITFPLISYVHTSDLYDSSFNCWPGTLNVCS